MITCAKCGKDNQDHYKFCLGCGSELAKGSSPKPFSPDTPPHGVKAAGDGGAGAGMETVSPTAAPPKQEAPAAASAPSSGDDSVTCGQCGHVNGPGSRFCAGCGTNLSAAPSSATPGAPSVGAGPAAPSGVSAAGAAAAAAVSAVASGSAATSVCLTALRADGTEAGNYTLPGDPKVTIGRDTGSIFAGDSYLSPRHASLTRQGDGLTVRDEESLNGVYLKLKPEEPWPLNFGDVFRIGQEIVKLEALEPQPPTADGVERLGSPKDGFVGRLALVIGRDTTGNAFPIPSSGVHCGRERGDILFSEDGYVSGLHCRVAPNEGGQLCLTDVGSSNGTFVRLNRDHSLGSGDILLMGQQLFRVDIG